MAKNKKDSKKKKKKNYGRSTRPIIIVSDTIAMSMIRSQVISSILRKEEIDSVIMFTKKADEKILDNIAKKTISFSLHNKYELHDKNGDAIAPISTDETGFSNYKISFKAFIKTIATDLVYSDRLFNNDNISDESDEIKSIYAVDTKSKGGNKIYYPWDITKCIGEVRNKKNKKLAYIRFDL